MGITWLDENGQAQYPPVETFYGKMKLVMAKTYGMNMKRVFFLFVFFREICIIDRFCEGDLEDPERPPLTELADDVWTRLRHEYVAQTTTSLVDLPPAEADAVPKPSSSVLIKSAHRSPILTIYQRWSARSTSPDSWACNREQTKRR